MMTKSVKIILAILLFVPGLSAQEAVEVTDQTIRVEARSEKVFYFGFAAGDKVTLNFSENNHRELNEFSVTEYPDNPVFSAYKVRTVDDKTFNVSKQGVYMFRLANNSIFPRVCSINIRRTPASAQTVNFNTSVAWVDKQITDSNTYTKQVQTGFDTTYVVKTRREVTKTVLSEDMMMDKTERVHSKSSVGNKNFSLIRVTLPKNETEPGSETHTIAWAYWIGVGKEASEAWTKNISLIKNIASGAATLLGASPLASMAIGAVSSLALPSMGDDVSYWLLPDDSNAQLFQSGKTFHQFDQGKGIAAYGKNTDRLQGTFYVALLNDNYVQGIDVDVKISVIRETKFYETRPTREPVLTPRYENKTFSEPVVKTVRIPATGQ